MSGISHKTPLRAWQWLMDKTGLASVAEMARITGISDDTLRNYIYKGSMPTVDKAARIARTLGVPLDELAEQLETASK